MEMRQQGHKSAEITIWQGLDRAGFSNCWEYAPGYQQPVPGPRHCPVVGHWDPSVGLPCQDLPLSGEIHGAETFLF